MAVKVMVVVAAMVVLALTATTVNAQISGVYTGGPWTNGNASLDGSVDTTDKIYGGACRYGDLLSKGYGVYTADLSPALFKNGLSCGSCFELKCVNDTALCRPGNRAIVITATNLAFDRSGFGQAFKFNLSDFYIPMPVFLSIAKYTANDVVPLTLSAPLTISYRRTPCKRRGGIRFTISRRLSSISVLVTNVAGAGDVMKLSVKGNNTQWLDMSRDHGQLWKYNSLFVRQTLSFQVTTSDGRISTSNNVVPSSWLSGQTFTGKNFPV